MRSLVLYVGESNAERCFKGDEFKRIIITSKKKDYLRTMLYEIDCHASYTYIISNWEATVILI